MYNDRPAHLVSTYHGATVESVENAGGGIVTRGLLVDAPMIRGVDWLERGEGVMPDDILEAERRCGFTVEEGDVLLVRTGQLRRRNEGGPRGPGQGLDRVPGRLPAAAARARRRHAGLGHRKRRLARALPFRAQTRSTRSGSSRWACGYWTTPTSRSWRATAPRQAGGSSCSPSRR